jgi:heterotetrameric sarcosine oxidase gamma subunit
VARGPFPFVGASRVEDGWEISSTVAGPLTLVDLSRLGKFSVRAVPGSAPSTLPAPWTSSRAADGRLVTAAAIGEWLVLTPSGAGAGIDEGGEILSVVDVTHGRALLRLTGAGARGVLAKLCAIDLADSVTPDGTSCRSFVGSIVVDVVRDDVKGTPSYLLHSERSAGRSLLHSLQDAGSAAGLVYAGDGGTTP